VQQLTAINSQIGAVNTTVAANLYIPSSQPGQTQLIGYNANPSNLPINAAQYCVVFSPDQMASAQNSTLLIQSQINSTIQEVLSLGPENNNRQTLANITNSYAQQNQYLQYLLQNPCAAQPSQPATTTALNSSASQTFQNYIVNNGGQLPQSSCPSYAPYIVGGACQNCVGSAPFYSVSLQQCVNCQTGTYFSEVTHSCNAINPSNPTHCSGGQYENINSTCVCLPSTPTWTGSACIACFAPNFVDPTSGQCLTCPSGYYYNGSICVSTNCSQTFTFDTVLLKCVCPWYTPQEVNGACTPCPAGTVYNKNTNQCIVCPQGSTISPDNTTCLCSSVYQKY
jgi:hypothetical protein